METPPDVIGKVPQKSEFPFSRIACVCAISNEKKKNKDAMFISFYLE